MKKVLFLLCLIAILSACNQSESVTLIQEETPEIGSRAKVEENQQPNVYVEEGCLVFKNFNVRDSIINMLEQLSDEQRISWEKNLGFISAKTYYAPYFYEYDNVTSEDESHLFAEKYTSILDITEDEDGAIDVDYPLVTPNFETILTSDGQVKIGDALYIYKKDRRIIIHLADIQKIDKYKNTLLSSKEDNVDVIYNGDARIMFRGNVVKDISLANSGGYIKSGKKKYSWELIYSLEKVMIDKSSFRNHVYLRLYQKAKKKYLGGWHDYSTKYSIHGTFVSIQGNGINTQYYGDEHSIERKSGANYTFFHLETPGVFNYGGEEHPRLNIVVRADHKSSFLSWPGYQLDYTGYTGSGTELYIFATTPPSKLYY